MCLKKNKGPVRLTKQRTLKEKIQDWMNKNYWYFVAIGVATILFLLIYLCIVFMPGTESGLYYNNRTGVI